MTGDGAQQQAHKLRWLNWALWALALAGLLYLVGLTIWLGVSGLLFPHQLDYGEGIMLHFVREWAQGRPIYTAIQDYPYVTSNYPPLSILLALVLTPILGITYAAGRLWTLVAIGAIAAILVAWIRRGSKQWLPAAIAALLFVGSPYIYHWAPLFRVDLVGLALTLGGLYAIFSASPPGTGGVDKKRRGCLFWLSVVLFVAGLYTKQSFFFAPAAAVAYLFFADRRQAIRLAVAIGVLGGGLFLVINAVTAGGFWQGLVDSNVNQFLWPEFWKQLGDFFGTFVVLGLLTVWYGTDKFLLRRKTPLREKVSPLDLYLPATLVGLLLAGKAGAWENYFFEALVAFALCSGLALARIAQSRKPLRRALAPLLALAQVALMWHSPGAADRYLQVTRRSNEEIAPILARTPDPIISEDMGLLVTHDKVLDYYTFQYSQLARAGRWEQTWELGQLRDRNLTLVILEEGTRLDVDRYQRFTRQFLSELDRNYRLARTVGKYELYEPDALQHRRRVEYANQLALVGWSLHAPPALAPGSTFSLTVVWQAQQALTTDYTAFAHLVDERGQGWAGDDHPPRGGDYPTSLWGADEMMRDTFTLTVPPDAPPGLYHVQVGWYHPVTQERLHAGDADSFRIAVLPVSWQATGSQAMMPLEVRFGGAISLEGYAWQVGSETIQVTLRWSTSAYLDADLTVFLHLVGSSGDQAISQGDAPPLGGRWPTSLWLPGMALDDAHIIPLPTDLQPGTYQLLVGLYDPVTGARLALPGGEDALRLLEIDLP